MQGDLLLLRRITWRDRLTVFALWMVATVICIHVTEIHIISLKLILFSSVLLLAAMYDLKSGIIPDWFHVLWLLIGLIAFNPVTSLMGMIFAPLPLLIVELVKAGSVGGGDIKAIGAWGFVLGYRETTLIVMVGLVLAMVFKRPGDRFPMLPYLYAGWFLLLMGKVFIR